MAKNNAKIKALGRLDHLDDGHPDPNMTPCYWLNKDAQNHYFESILWLYYPHIKEEQKKFICKPGVVTLLPHKYLKVSSRDGTPCKGAWVVGEMIEDFARGSLEYADKN